MGGCCRPDDYDQVFHESEARRKARAYDRKGAHGDARRIVDLVRRRVAPGYTLLEVGGGIGEIQLELMRDGASSAVNVELATTYEAAASELIAKHGLGDRIERRLGDFVAEAPSLGSADVVILNRVVCCYPDVDGLVGAAAGRARRLLLITMPVDRWWVRGALAVGNLPLRIRGSRFRGYVHRTRRVIDAAEHRGHRVTALERGFIWQMIAFER